MAPKSTARRPKEDRMTTTPTALDRLSQELQVWRQTTPTKANAAKDPDAQALYDLNMAWSKTRAEHDALLARQRTEFLEERARLLRLIAAKKPFAPTPEVKSGPGRPPRAPYSDAVKRAAYRALIETGRSRVRATMALTNAKDLPLFEQTIAEGKTLVLGTQADYELRA
jgi:hypothetical protein